MKILGFTEEINSCGLCGRSELKGTWVIELSNGEIEYLGSTCVKSKHKLSEMDFRLKIKDRRSELNKQRVEFMREANEKFRKVANKYPTVNKYTPDEKGYIEFMYALNHRSGVRKLMGELFSFKF